MNKVSHKKYLVSRERVAMLAPIYWNAQVQTAPETMRHHGVTLGDIWVHFAPGNIYRGIHSKSHFESAGKHIARRIINDPTYLLKLDTLARKHKNSIEKFSSTFPVQQLSSLPFKKLLGLTQTIKSHWLAYDQATVLPWFVGAEHFRKMLLTDFGIPVEDFDLLAAPEEKTIISQLERMLLHTAQLVKKKCIKKEILSHDLAARFSHLPFGYDGPDYWDEQAFSQKIEEKLLLSAKEIEKELVALVQFEDEIKQRKSEKIMLHGLNRHHLDHIHSFHVLTNWTDQRKDLDFRLHYYYAQIMWELERRYQLPYQNLKYLFTDELPFIDKQPNELYLESQRRMVHDFVFRYAEGERTILNENETAEFLIKIKKQEHLRAMLKGMVAAKGDKEEYTGAARIALTPQEAALIKPGEFLVTTMTTPDFIVAMKRADGFITDEGGVTCHAAIVAREMRKPCIIGTKKATKLLKNGDRLHIDMRTGIIKRLL